MEEKRKNCKPTIVNEDMLMTGDGVFVGPDIYKKNCDSKCKLKSVCGVVINMLTKGDLKGALSYLKKNK